jgi:hypothetical protein
MSLFRAALLMTILLIVRCSATSLRGRELQKVLTAEDFVPNMVSPNPSVPGSNSFGKVQAFATQASQVFSPGGGPSLGPNADGRFINIANPFSNTTRLDASNP